MKRSYESKNDYNDGFTKKQIFLIYALIPVIPVLYFTPFLIVFFTLKYLMGFGFITNNF